MEETIPISRNLTDLGILMGKGLTGFGAGIFAGEVRVVFPGSGEEGVEGGDEAFVVDAFAGVPGGVEGGSKRGAVVGGVGGEAVGRRGVACGSRDGIRGVGEWEEEEEEGEEEVEGRDSIRRMVSVAHDSFRIWIY